MRLTFTPALLACLAALACTAPEPASALSAKVPLAYDEATGTLHPVGKKGHHSKGHHSKGHHSRNWNHRYHRGYAYGYRPYSYRYRPHAYYRPYGYGYYPYYRRPGVSLWFSF
jgi:hypothetical protein